MPNTLIISEYSPLYSPLWESYVNSDCFCTCYFKEYLMGLDENIIDYVWHTYTATFKDEQSKMFFILKYS